MGIVDLWHVNNDRNLIKNVAIVFFRDEVCYHFFNSEKGKTFYIGLKKIAYR